MITRPRPRIVFANSPTSSHMGLGQTTAKGRRISVANRPLHGSGQLLRPDQTPMDVVAADLASGKPLTGAEALQVMATVRLIRAGL